MAAVPDVNVAVRVTIHAEHLDEEQRQRAEACIAARAVLRHGSVLGTAEVSALEVMDLASYILDGSPPDLTPYHSLDAHD